MKTHTLTPELNAAIDRYRNACFKGRDVNIARAELEELIKSDWVARTSRVEPPAIPPEDQELASWLEELLDFNRGQVDLARREGHEKDLAFAETEVRMLTALHERLGWPVPPDRETQQMLRGRANG